ncbi:hypothetical protein ETAA8_28470 [Anatilimnocola aggregata]|uniref:Uncharacterized protein n=1 Tax=Anatilimnocola aggregata TaxID=2528021 RepID=A0A517YBY3_9BACT|nr:hypothetical protein [Anatilimnocola aggregata]QDU27757.1 hypothetical protein ETAA8_28470 [Anatilimnocola aggregata]
MCGIVFDDKWPRVQQILAMEMGGMNPLERMAAMAEPKKTEANLSATRARMSEFTPVGVDPATNESWHGEIDVVTGDAWQDELPQAKAAFSLGTDPFTGR